MLNIVKLPEGTFPYIPVTSLVQKPPLAGLGLVQEGMAQGTLGAEALFRVDLQQTSEGRAEKFSPSFHRWELPPGGPQNRLIMWVKQCRGLPPPTKSIQSTIFFIGGV